MGTMGTAASTGQVFLAPPPPPGPPPQFRPHADTLSTDKLSHVHPVLKRHLGEYHKAFKGSLMFGKILASANIRWEDLPTLPEFVDDKGKNMICFNHICGRCPFCPCRLRKGHVPKDKIPDDWADALWRKIEPGIRYNFHAAATGTDMGSPAKRQRT